MAAHTTAADTAGAHAAGAHAAGDDNHLGHVGEIIGNIRDDVRHLVQGEIELAKAELVPAAKSAGIGAGLLGAAGYFAITAASLLFVAAALGIYAGGLPLWASFLIMGFGLLIIGGILGLIGLKAVQRVKPPQQTIAEAKRSLVAVKGALARGQASAKTPIEGSVAEQ